MSDMALCAQCGKPEMAIGHSNTLTGPIGWGFTEMLDESPGWGGKETGHWHKFEPISLAQLASPEAAGIQPLWVVPLSRKNETRES